MELQPFSVDIPEAAVQDLRLRLANARWPAQLPGAPWERGVPVEYLQNLSRYWGEQFDWRATERLLNSHPQFRTDVGGQTVHFLHVRSPSPDAVPLLLLHGWPGSVIEFLDVIGPLADPEAHGLRAPAFDLVIPSLIGFGFSTPLSSAGWTPARNAEAFVALMGGLGYPRFGVQGGDFGAAIGPEVGRLAADRVIGVHVNAPVANFRSSTPIPAEELASLTDVERRRAATASLWRAERMGYFKQQATRPQTLSYGLTDSPIGQLAWIVEKFKEWTNAGHALPEDAVSRDRLLANVSLYWFTGTAASSANIYYEVAHARQRPTPSRVPTAVANFAEDMGIRRYAERWHNIVRWNDFDAGGHFAALETPELLVRDIGQFFSSLV
ncbi:epoxide hydrolase family protein [Mycobacterium stomatepiae]|uniref:Microsomal epoxide hydrolase n=1 Tax=Mycobacterium stomatepiae TaxID=470076 RepID=A0A7I7Q734_9MYCO|nr:epoxide hydrolase family protein [Mycobacterium stomatepiae]MCV7163011.1 epoxide hydrolase [Mycobacterium stomatepiae]BBY22154.1 microsomal epoxide hydrolase [Mycobacterium stomatepiae]